MQARLMILAVICAGLIGAGQHRTGSPPFYRVVSPATQDTSYIFGTLHLLEGSFVDTMTNVMHALHGADEVVGELVMDSSATGDALQALLAGPPLDSLLSAGEYREVSKAVKTYAHLPMMFLGHAQPIVVYTMILAGMYGKAHPENHKTGLPMDVFFEQEAKKHGKPVLGLEEAAAQEELLDSIPIAEQVKDLVDLVSNPKRAMRQMEKMLADYRAGKIAEILDDPSFGSMSQDEMESLIYARNEKWLDTLPKLMRGRRLFIAVGAGHLPGPHGLLDGFRSRGFHVEAVRPR